jgi:uncharacterized protein
MSRDVRVLRDLRVPTDDPAITLSADLFIATTLDRVPVLVTLLPYRNDAASGIEYDAALRWFAARGYACLLVDFRGTGASDGEQRSPFDPKEADDALVAIEWAAHQPWCNGRVGMWGMSYGAIVALRTAAYQPQHLRAILAIEGALDPELDFIHPAGSFGCLGSIGLWGTETLVNQMLPPLQDYGSDEQQRRWQQRCQMAEPWLIDLVRNPPGHPVWRSRAIDASKIVVPSFIVAGWRDLFCDASLRAYESISAPKKLLVGPWMHTFPDASTVESIEFRSLALQWWDYWLKDSRTGIMAAPPVTVFVQGACPEWRSFEIWPPQGTARLLATTSNLTLRPISPERTHGPGPVKAIGKWRADATVGTLSGLWGIPTSGFGRPIDQHDDDVRSISATSLATESDTVIIGRPIVRVKWDGAGAPGRLVARLTDVDEQGISTLITTGVLAIPQRAESHEIILYPTCYRVRRGQRLRIALGNADFPRLWPADTTEDEARGGLNLIQLELEIIGLGDVEGTVIEFPSPESLNGEQGPLALHLQPTWKITRDPIMHSVQVLVGQRSISFTPNGEHLLEMSSEIVATVSREEPNDATVVCNSLATIRMKTGNVFVVRVNVCLRRNAVYARACILLNDKSLLSREWRA